MGNCVKVNLCGSTWYLPISDTAIFNLKISCQKYNFIPRLIKSVGTANGISVLSFARAKKIFYALVRRYLGFWIRDPANWCCASSSLTTGWCRDTTEIITIVHDDLELAFDIVTVVYELKTNKIIWHCLCRSRTRINKSNTLILQRHRHCRSRTQSNEPFLSSVTGVFSTCGLRSSSMSSLAPHWLMPP